MWISVIASLACFAVATLLFTPVLRTFKFYRAFAVYFIFQGLWLILNRAFSVLIENQDFMINIEYLGSIIFVGYLAYSLYKYYSEVKDSTENNDD